MAPRSERCRVPEKQSNTSHNYMLLFPRNVVETCTYLIRFAEEMGKGAI